MRKKRTENFTISEPMRTRPAAMSETAGMPPTVPERRGVA
jgi:hypothetical protein